MYGSTKFIWKLLQRSCPPGYLGLAAAGRYVRLSVVQELEQQSGGAILMREGSLYPVLYRLLDAGYISDQKVQVGRRMTRVYYHIEPAGAKHLQRLIVEYKAMTDGVLRIIGGGGDSERA